MIFSENARYRESIFVEDLDIVGVYSFRIVNRVAEHDNFFIQKRDAFDKLGLSRYLAKNNSYNRMLVYETLTNITNYYIRIGESTTIECLKRFCQAVIEVF